MFNLLFFSDRDFLTFETVTVVPIQTKMIGKNFCCLCTLTVCKSAVISNNTHIRKNN